MIQSLSTARAYASPRSTMSY